MQVEVVRSLCRQCGLPDKGLKLECVLRLQKTVCNINMSIIIVMVFLPYHRLILHPYCLETGIFVALCTNLQLTSYTVRNSLNCITEFT